MKLASGSLYKAFGDKRAIFLAAFERAGMVRGETLRRIIGTAKPARDRIRDALTFYAEASYGVEGKRGCIVVGSAAELTTLDADVAKRVTASLHKTESLMAELIQQGQVDGSIPAALDSTTTARLMLCLLQGMRVVGKTGRSRKEMTEVADAAMKLLV